MLLSRFVRAQLIIFSVLSVIGLTVMATVYMKLPARAGVSTMRISMDLPAAGGLYRFGNVTYRGVQVGQVTGVDLTRDGVRVTMTVDSSRRIPADLRAEVRSVSAVGEQYVELLPQTESAPYLREGSVIERADTDLPQPVGPMLDQVSTLVGTIPSDKLRELLDEMFAGLNGAGYDLGSLLSSTGQLAAGLNSVGDTTRTLVQDSGPLLDSQVRSADAIRIWARSLEGVTGQLVANDPQIRTLLTEGPGSIREVNALLDAVKPTLPVLLANLTSLGQVAVTYNAGLEQALVLLPPAIAMIQAVHPVNNASGLGLGDFRISGISTPPACTVGFLPPNAWRSPADTTTIDLPDDVYCKLPQDSPIAVRGARNIPCAEHPGKRAPTVALCNSPEGFQPLATEQPVIGPYPPDPNLESQGIPSDPGAAPEGAAPEGPDRLMRPSFGIAHYDPRTGNYVGPDGKLYGQSDLATSATGTKDWTRLMPR